MFLLSLQALETHTITNEQIGFNVLTLPHFMQPNAQHLLVAKEGYIN